MNEPVVTEARTKSEHNARIWIVPGQEASMNIVKGIAMTVKPEIQECAILARLDALENRVSRLRRANRTLMVALCALAGMAAAGLTASTVSSPEVIRAKRIQMVDDTDQVRAELGIDEHGSAGLFVLDSAGLIRATLVHDEAQTAMYLMDDKGVVRLGAAQFAHGGGGIALHGPEHKGAAVMMLKDNAGTLTFYDEQGRVISRTPDIDSATETRKATTVLPQKD